MCCMLPFVLQKCGRILFPTLITKIMNTLGSTQPLSNKDLRLDNKSSHCIIEAYSNTLANSPASPSIIVKERSDAGCTFYVCIKWPCLICCFLEAYQDSMKQQWPIPYHSHIVLNCCTFVVHPNSFLVAVWVSDLFWLLIPLLERERDLQWWCLLWR